MKYYSFDVQSALVFHFLFSKKHECSLFYVFILRKGLLTVTQLLHIPCSFHQGSPKFLNN